METTDGIFETASNFYGCLSTFGAFGPPPHPGLASQRRPGLAQPNKDLCTMEAKYGRLQDKIALKNKHITNIHSTTHQYTMHDIKVHKIYTNTVYTFCIQYTSLRRLGHASQAIYP